MLDIFKALRNLEGLCIGRAHVGAGRTSGMSQGCAQCDVEFHLAARVPVRSGPESGKRLLDPATALLN
jgi:hypothetical protein